MTEGRTSRQRAWSLLLKMAVSLLLLGFLLFKVDVARIAAVLEGIEILPAVLAVIVLMVVPAISIPRWRVILLALGHDLPAGMLGRGLYIGALFNQMLPSSIGGDAWRIWFCTRAGVPAGTATVSVLIERLVGLLAVFLTFCVTFPLLLQKVGDAPLRWVLWLMVAGCLGIVIALAIIGGVASRLDAFALLRPLAFFGRALRAVARSGRVSLLVGTGLLGQFTAILALFLVGLSVKAPLSLIACTVTLAPALLVALVPVSVGGWGVREGAFVVLLGFYGIRPEQSLVVSVLFGLALLVASLPGLVAWLGRPVSGTMTASGRDG